MMTRINILLFVVMFVLSCVLFAPAQQASQTTPPPPAIGGSGKTNFITMWLNSTTLGSSKVFQTATGATAFGSTLSMPSLGTATTAAGFNSQVFDSAASVFSHSAGVPTTAHFQWLTEPVGNNTATPSGKFNLRFALGTGAPVETGVSFSNAGAITAKRLVSTVTTGTAPFTVTSTTQVPNLNVSFLGGLGASAYARLAAANTFTGSQSVIGNLSATGNITGGSFSGNGSGLTSVNAAFLNGLSSGAFAFVGSANTFAGSQTINNNLAVTGKEFFTGPIQFADGTSSLLVNSTDCCIFGTRMIWAHSPSFPTWGIYYDDNLDVMHWQQALGSDLMTMDFDTGNLSVTGAITAGTKDFKIDHPLDPKNKFLYHGSVESSEMMNIYTGNAVLDPAGEAVIALPKWFEAVNADFRYQLTAVGAPAPNLHVAQEIANHQFTIGGGSPGMKVSWQVTGVRHDAYAKTHPLVVEVKKSATERGHYLHPDAYGVPKMTQEQMRARGLGQQ